MTLQRATHVFAHGFAFTRSRTHPYIVEQKHGLTLMRDAPRKRGDERNPEYIIVGMTPKQGIAALKRANFTRGGACVISDDQTDLDPVRDAYKAAGLRLIGRQPFFIADPEKAPTYKSPVLIRRIETPEHADAVKRAAGRHQLTNGQLGREDTIRVYAAFNGRSVVGYVSSVPVEQDAWVSNLAVVKEMRGRGIGRALMSFLLQDDARHGVQTSVLLASGAGARLYPHVGYERIGTLQLFVATPKWGKT
jgi:predicted N-acetyltransferase YhbS